MVLIPPYVQHLCSKSGMAWLSCCSGKAGSQMEKSRGRTRTGAKVRSSTSWSKAQVSGFIWRHARFSFSLSCRR